MISSSPLDWWTPQSLPSSDHWIGSRVWTNISQSFYYLEEAETIERKLKKRRKYPDHWKTFPLNRSNNGFFFFFLFFHEGESDVWPIRWSYKARRNIIMKGYTIPLHILSLDILKLKWVLNDQFLISVIGIPSKLNTSYYLEYSPQWRLPIFISKSLVIRS